MRFFTSDTHFGHERIITLSDRPFDNVGEMNEALIDNWNSKVSAGDTVYHLGDVALGPWAEWDSILTQLNGYKILVIGNHDRIFQTQKQSQRDKFMPLYNEWFEGAAWDAVQELELANEMLVHLSHFPYDGDSHDGDRFESARLEDRGTILIHGHTHRNSKVSYSKSNTLQIHVGVDAWNYSPVSENEIIHLIEANRDES